MQFLIDNQQEVLISEVRDLFRSQGISLGWLCPGVHSEGRVHKTVQKIDLKVKEPCQILGHTPLLALENDENIRVVIETESIKNKPKVRDYYQSKAIGVFIISTDYLANSFVSFCLTPVLMGYWFRPYLQIECKECESTKERKREKEKTERELEEVKEYLTYLQEVQEKEPEITRLITSAYLCREQQTLIYQEDDSLFVVVEYNKVSHCLETISLDSVDINKLLGLVREAREENEYAFFSPRQLPVELRNETIHILDTEDGFFFVKEGDWFCYIEEKEITAKEYDNPPDSYYEQLLELEDSEEYQSYKAEEEYLEKEFQFYRECHGLNISFEQYLRWEESCKTEEEYLEKESEYYSLNYDPIESYEEYLDSEKQYKEEQEYLAKIEEVHAFASKTITEFTSEHLPFFQQVETIERQRLRKKPGRFYAISDSVSCVKMGKTGRGSGSMRAKDGQTYNANKLELLFDSGLYYSFGEIESYIHKHFELFVCKNGGSEWFKLTEEEAIDFLVFFFTSLNRYLHHNGISGDHDFKTPKPRF